MLDCSCCGSFFVFGFMFCFCNVSLFYIIMFRVCTFMFPRGSVTSLWLSSELHCQSLLYSSFLMHAACVFVGFVFGIIIDIFSISLLFLLLSCSVLIRFLSILLGVSLFV